MSVSTILSPGLTLLSVTLAVAGCDTSPGSPDTSDGVDEDAGDVAGGDAGHDTGDLSPSDTETMGPDATATCVPEPGDPSFDDHTVTRLGTRACFDLMAGATSDPRTVKLVVLDISNTRADTPEPAELRFYDSTFYALHDEWYWFRLLNGHPIPGLTVPAPVDGLAFASIAAVYEHFAGKDLLPLDLVRLGGSGPLAGRLYSPGFYRLAGLAGQTNPQTPPFLGLASVLHFAPNADRKFPHEIWGFELEYTHAPPVAEVVRFFALIEAKLPPEVRGRLRWIARSPAQRTIATTLRASGHPLGPRTLTYDDLVVNGRVEVYNEGIAAGIVEIFPPTFSPSDIRADRLAVLPLVPDDLPPSRAIVSAVPQTALAHVNLLAKARGTPNAHIAGVLENARVRDWAYLSTPLIFEARADAVRWQPITSAQYSTYLGLSTPPERHVAQVDLTEAPLLVDLEAGDITDMAGLVPLVGGKAAGFLSFLALPDMALPDAPVALTIRPFREHVAELEPLIRAALDAPDFRNDVRVRFLTLEGEASYRALNGDNPAALSVIGDLAIRHAGGPLGELLRRGGVKRLVSDKDMDPETLRTLHAELANRFAFLAPRQGLRFRSSSTAEDVPGFNGAGLYVSHTGFLYPSQLGDPADRHRTIEWAIKQTWASYWGFQAFEERRIGRVDHFEGAMGVVVHPRFDDDKERANAVMTFWWGDHPGARRRRLVVNVQKGSLAVTNPGGTSERAEIDEVISEGEGLAPRVVRVQASSLSPGAWLLSDDELLTLFAAAERHTGRWLQVSASGASSAERPRSLVLDYELKAMHPGWPAMASGELRPARIVWRQARVLDQVDRLQGLSDPWTPGFSLASMMPRDLRTVARKVDALRCVTALGDFRVYRVETEPDQSALFPFAAKPLIYRAWVDFSASPPGLEVDLVGRVLPWTALVEATVEARRWRVRFDPENTERLGIEGFELTAPEGETAGRARIWRGATSHEATCTTFSPRTPYQSPSDYLRSLMPATP